MSTPRKRSTSVPPAEEKLVVASEVELVFKNKVPVSQMPQVNNAQEAYWVLRAAWNENTIDLREEFKILLLNHAQKVLGIYHAFSGNGKSVNVDLRLLFTAALKANAAKIILAHNHPSGALKPSKGDKMVTQRAAFVADFMEIGIVDHLIVTRDGFYSMADNGDM